MRSQEFQWTAVPYDVEKRDGETVLSVAIAVLPKLQDSTSAPAKLGDYPDMIDWPTTLNTIRFTIDIDGRTVNHSDLKFKDELPDTTIWKAVFPDTTLVRPFEYKPFTDFKIVSFPVKGILATTAAMYKNFAKEFSADMPVITPDSIASSISTDTSNYTANQQGQQLHPALQIIRDLIPDNEGDQAYKSLQERWEKQAVGAMEKDSTATQPRPIEQRPVNLKEVTPENMLFKPFDAATPLGQLRMAEVYHTARNYSRDGKLNGKAARRVSRPKIERPKFDFHQVVSVMREYPVMMRKLGIVLHVEFRLPGGVDKEGAIGVKVDWANPKTNPTVHRTPKVAYRLDTSGDPQYWQFLPRPSNDSEIVGPVLCLNNASHFGITQIDVDTAALKTINYTRGLKERLMHMRPSFRRKADPNDPKDPKDPKIVDRTPPDERVSAAPPSTRGTGLSLIRHNRALKLAKALLRSANNFNRIIAGQEVLLYSDDLLRGYRIDIWDETAGRWDSLCRRDAQYRFPLAGSALKTEGIAVKDEEGVLSMAASRPRSSESTPIRDLYVHEIVAQWEGWSLVVPHIGSYIGTEDELAAEQRKSTPPADFEYQVETEFRVPKNSLPRLRFGRKYRMRARFADINGNGPKKDELNPTDFTCATPLVNYLRWDPVVSPTIALRNHPVEGESLERVVIRNYNASENDGDEVDTAETSDRHLFPPVASQQMCERHGMFDSTPTGPMRGEQSTYDMIKNRQKDIPSQWYTRGNDGSLKPQAGLDTPPPPAQKDEAVSYPFVNSGPTEAPYLSDPIARGVTLQKIPGMTAGEFMEVTLGGVNSATIASTGGVVSVCFDPMSSWPAIRSIVIRLASGNGKPSWDPGTRVLTIFLPKGEQAWITFSSNVGETKTECGANLDMLGQWGTLGAAGLTPAALDAAARGLGWLVTPGRTLHLVHATQKPLKKPQIKDLSVYERFFGATEAGIRTTDTYVHARTSHKIDVNAEWDMWEDDPLKPEPVLLKQSAFVYEHLCEDRTNDKIEHDHIQEFGDTKFRAVTYTPTATTRFREYLPAPLRKDAANLTRRGIGKAVDVLSTKRPDAANLLYVVPSFKWVEETKVMSGKTITSTRKGGGLRVYLDRPWYSSGNGELVGVLLYSTQKFTPTNPSSGSDSKDSKDTKNKDNKTTLKPLTMTIDASKGLQASQFGSIAALMGDLKLDIPEQLHPYVTQWGLDPIWLSAPTPSDSSPRIANFINPAKVLTSVSIAEVAPTQRFICVGYTPKFDKERKLWYCDIEIDPGQSYYPFIRLALVRMQPKSVANENTGEDVYVSRVIQSEFCQIPPDRQAIVKVEDDDKALTVSVIGPTYRMNSTGQQGSEMEVTVEKRDAGVAGSSDLGWTPVVTQRIDRIHAANMWSGMISLPDAVGSSQYRVVVKEYEQFYSDPQDSRRRANSLGDKGSNSGDVELTFDKRIVYADVLPLS